MNKILVTGASGGLGRGIVENLLLRMPSSRIAVLARDPAKVDDFRKKGVEVRVGDYADTASLNAAFQDIEKLMFVSTTAFSDALTQHRNVIAAAKRAGVGHVHYTGIQRPAESTYVISQVSEWEKETEKALAESGLAVTLLRNTMYFDALPFMLGPNIHREGVRAPAGSRKAALAARSDLAEGAAVVLAGGNHQGKTYNFGGSEALSMAEIAAVLSGVFGRSLPYLDLPADEFVAARIDEGAPAVAASFFAEWFGAIAAGEFAEVSGDLETMLGRPPLTAAQVFPLLFANAA